MEVKIGIQSVPRELVVETDTPADEIERQLASALTSDDHSVFSNGGTAIVIHAVAAESSGNAPARIACGVITKPE